MLQKALEIYRVQGRGGMRIWLMSLSEAEREQFFDELNMSIEKLQNAFAEVGRIFSQACEAIIPAVAAFSAALEKGKK